MNSRMKSLYQRAKKADKAAACELLTLSYPDIYAYFRRLSGSNQDAEDLTQAGKFEKEFVKEWAKDGITFHLYKISYTLSSGKVVTRNEIEGGSGNESHP
jgi:hypothetical protein